MKREFLETGDGSVTIHLPDWNEQYHSKHGALNEALHVFIETGFNHVLQQELLPQLHVLEIGFGTGLNALLTLLSAGNHEQKVKYRAIEAYPVSLDEVSKLNYAELLKCSSEIFNGMHEVSWGKNHQITDYFSLYKEEQFFSEISAEQEFHLIYFDAFGARVQPELWTEAIFKIMHQALMPKGVLVTYSAKGSVRRAMQAVGFTVERLPGPPGKREMLRATK